MATDPSGENPRFELQSVLFSRSDARGLITGANASFQKVSGFDWDTLIGSPHSVLRHPDMPNAVFQGMWQRLRAGQPFAGYLQNQAQDGVAYWVFATVVPVADGYMSLQIMPKSRILDRVMPIYDRLLSRESAEETAPYDGAAEFETAIQELGFDGSLAFMSFALREELVARDTQPRRDANPVWDALSDIFQDIEDLENRARDVKTTFRHTHQIPYNMRLQASKLEGSGGPISVISSNYRQMTQSLEQSIDQFDTNSSLGSNIVHTAMVNICVHDLLAEFTGAHDTQQDRFYGDQQAEMSALRTLAATCQNDTLRDVQALSDNVRRFGQQCQDMRRMMSGLELTRIMCKIERSKYQGDLGGLDEIVKRLEVAQQSLNASFDGILISVGNIVTGVNTVARLMPPQQDDKPSANAA